MEPQSSHAPPSRSTSHRTESATLKLITVVGRNANPVSSGVKPSTLCRYWVVKNQKLNIPPRKSRRPAYPLRARGS
jgi:hypothetical protein